MKNKHNDEQENFVFSILHFPQISRFISNLSPFSTRVFITEVMHCSQVLESDNLGPLLNDSILHSLNLIWLNLIIRVHETILT